MIKNIQLTTIDCIDWRGEKQYPEGRNNKEKKSNNDIFHSLSRVVVPATLHSISVNAHFTRFL